MLGHITTFGGHPVNCASAIANLEALEEENPFMKERVKKGQLLEESINHNKVIEQEEKDHVSAVEFESPELVQKIVERYLTWV